MTTKPTPHITIGILNYHTKNLLDRCLSSVFSQNTKYSFEVYLYNNSPEENLQDLIKKYNLKNIHTYNKNVGFCKGHNDIIKASKNDYCLCLNSDVFLENNYIEECINILEKNNKAAAVTGKLLWYDKKNNKETNIIDTTGIEKTSWYRFYDRGMGEIDSGQYDTKKNIFGVSAAAAIYRRDALENIKDAHGYFDERFFSYKEDIDLSWRFNKKNYISLFAPSAIGYHIRGTHTLSNKPSIKEFIKHRTKVPIIIQARSLRNQILMLIKNLFV